MAENTGLASSDVSAGDDANASQYNNLRADAKKMRQESMTAGATINGATLPVPVYQDTSDNEVYACDADDTDKLNFIGFAITNAIDAGAIVVQHTGIVGGFAGLDEGEKYYVQDAVGTIGKTPGTYEILVGIAISATELLILKGSEEYIGSANVDTDGTTTTTVPAGTRKIIVKAHKAGAGNATTGNGFSGGEIVLKKEGITEALVSMCYDKATGGSPGQDIRLFRAIWVTATTMTGKTFSGAYTIETEDTGYTITAYFYK